MRTLHQVEPLELRQLLAIQLVGDFNNTLTAGSWAREPVVIDSVGYMFANDGVHGTELWRTDGTEAGTWMVGDRNPGAAGLGGFSIEQANGLMYFPATDNSGNVNVWRSDGTTTGTIRLTTAATPNEQFLIGDVLELNGAAIFGSHYWGVWRSDGTPQGTMQIARVAATSFARLADHVYFLGAPLKGGSVALWKSDGTGAGTSIVREFSSSRADSIFQANGKLYFWADDKTVNAGLEPWSSDGTTEGTAPLADLAAGPGSSALARHLVFDDAVYFIASDDTDNRRLKLYRTNSTTGSVFMVADVGQLNGYSYEQPDIAVFDGAMYFRGSRSSTGSELWRSDGTPQGTGEVLDLNPGLTGSGPSAFAIYNGRLYFKAYTTTDGVEMYSTDGTAEGTRLLKSIAPKTRGIEPSRAPTPVVLNNRLFFRADDFVHGMEMWSTDGTHDGTTMLKDINACTKDFNPGTMTAGPGGLQFFTAKGHDNFLDLWKTDGTPNGTTMVKDMNIFPGPPSGQIFSPTFVNDVLLFGAYHVGGLELWRSDGTEEGTFRVIDLAPGSASGMHDGNLVKVGNRVFFAGTTQTTSQDFGLWVSDGTAEGTREVKPADSTFVFERPFAGIELHGRLLFQAAAYFGPEWAEAALFISDGTNAGTTVVQAGFRNRGATNWTVFGDEAYFVAETVEAGMELWRTDGTPEGTALVRDIVAGSGSSSPSNLIATPDALYFTATDRSTGRQLWRVSSTQPQPQRITTLPSGVDQVRASATGGVILSTADKQIYRFGGAGLIPLMTSVEHAPVLHGTVGGADYFTAATPAAGGELWRTDGTPAGTRMVHDLNPGTDHGWPINLGEVGGRIVMSAYVPAVGRELFVLLPFSAASWTGGLDAFARQTEPERLIEALSV